MSSLLPHRRGSSFAQFGLLSLLFLDTGRKELGIVVAVQMDKMVSGDGGCLKTKLDVGCGNLRSFAGSLSTATLKSNTMTLALEALGSDQSLNLGGLGVVLLPFTGDGPADDIFADIVLLVKTEESAELGGTLGSEALGVDHVGKSRDFTLTLLDNAESEDGEIETSDGWRK